MTSKIPITLRKPVSQYPEVNKFNVLGQVNIHSQSKQYCCVTICEYFCIAFMNQPHLQI